MRVLIVTYYFPKLTETFILDRIVKLLDRGIDVKILAIYNSEGVSFYEDPKPETVEHPQVKAYNLLNKTIYLNSTDPINFKTKVQELSPDVIHFQWSFLAEQLLEGITIDFPIFVNYHETKLPTSWKQKNDLLEYKNVISKATLHFPISTYIKKYLINLGCPEKVIKVHPTGTDIHKFRPIKKNLPQTDPEIINIVTNGSFIEKKGHEYSLHALKMLKDKGFKKFMFHIIGSGRFEYLYKELVKQYGLKNNVSFLGRITKEQVIQVYQNSHIFLLPSVAGYDNSEEGLPVASIEAASCGLPIVATKHTGTPDLVKQGVNGYMAKERNIFELYEYIEKLVKNPTIRNSMSTQSRKIAKDKFDLDKLVDELITYYYKVS